MMDWSSVVDAGLVAGAGLAVLLMGLWTLSVESSTVSISDSTGEEHKVDWSWLKAA